MTKEDKVQIALGLKRRCEGCCRVLLLNKFYPPKYDSDLDIHFINVTLIKCIKDYMIGGRPFRESMKG